MKRLKQSRTASKPHTGETLQTLEPRLLFSAVPLITEFVASNDTGLQDEDGERSDWIELYNGGDTALGLNGWHLTDDAGDLDRWSLPDVSLAPGQFMVVFASGKDRADSDGTELHTNFKLSAGGEYLALVEADGVTVAHDYAPQYPAQQADVSYGLAMSTSSETLVDDTSAMRYHVPTSGALGLSWTQPGFNDAAWAGGAGTTGGLGYENSPGAGTNFAAFIDTTLPSGTTSAYARFTFNVADPSSINALTLGMMYDDGFVAYLNGERVAADFEPAVVQWDSAATDGRGDGVVIEDFVDFDLGGHLDELLVGTNVLAIHALNTPGSSDMLMIPKLVAGSGSVVQPVETGFLSAPTPGQTNGSTFLGFVGDTAFSIDRGFFTSAFSVAITTPTPGADIYYTTDGSAPSTTHGTLYTGAVPINTTTVLRAVATKPGFASSNIDTQSYFFLEDVLQQDGAGLPTPPNGTSTWDYVLDPDIVNDPRYSGALIDDLMSIPTLSLVMDAQDAWGPNGFYANPRQSGIAWERPVSVELIGTDGTGLFQQDAGIRIMGSGSTNRAVGKKSMRLVFREEYGAPKLLYPFFGAEHTDEINSIAIRGNYFDTWTFQSDSGGLGGPCCGRSRSSYLRDQFAHETHDAMGGFAIGGDWVHLYINGQYWGLYNPTERPDDEFMQSYFGGSDADYDIIKTGVELVDGDLTGWNAMMQIALGNGPNGSLSNNAAYNDLQQYLDMEQFADYLLLNFWGGNHDWPHNNWYAVRDRAANGAFTFISWDAENFLFSVNSDRTGVSTANSPGVLYDRLRQNAEFRQLFADRVHEHMFNGGALSTAATTARFQSIVDTIRPALNAEAARWGDELTPNDPYNVIDHYDPFVDEKLDNYFPARNGIVLSQLRAAGLYPATSFEAPSFAQHGGVLPTGQVTIINNEAVGNLYYTLDGSDPRAVGGGVNAGAILYTGTLALPDHATVTARLLRSGTWSAKLQAGFVLADTPADATNLRVAELHYNPQVPSAAEQAAGFTDGDAFEFIELINTSGQTISLHGVQLKRTVVDGALDGIAFTFGLDALAPGQRIVVVSDLAAFTQRYGTGINVAGQYAGNLANSGETLRLTDADNSTIQQFVYDDAVSWPATPDGDGPSLVVINNQGNYNNANNWKASTTTHGTPGQDEAVGIAGDITGDGFVGTADLDALLALWGDAAASSPEAAAADLDASGTVGSGDLSIVIANFGNGSAPANPTSNGQTPADPDTGNSNNNNSAGSPTRPANTRPTAPDSPDSPATPASPTPDATPPPARRPRPQAAAGLTPELQRAAVTRPTPNALALTTPVDSATKPKSPPLASRTPARRFDALALL
ncbi:lamin tail domain-containing protein [Phycisphaeraceae bacterium D3-23]